MELKIPSRPEFVSIARLAILGVASRAQFSYDEVEDVRLAVGEACTTAVERATKANKPNSNIVIHSEIFGNKLAIEIRDDIAKQIQLPVDTKGPEDIDEQGLGVLLMELLVDEFSIEAAPSGGTIVRMVKYVG